MSDSQQPAPAVAARAIVVGHGEVAAGLVSAVDQISGRGSVLIPLSVQKLCLEDIEGLLRSRMSETGVRVIFTDLQAGSCTIAARRLLRGMEAVLIAGVNLPMLLDFVFADDKPATEAAKHAAERGRAAISTYANA
jgi:mannose/fructose-specific phosphotransferase system component IIA